MIKHKRIGAIAALLMAMAVVAVCYAMIDPSALASYAGRAQPAYAAVMDKTQVISIEIIADPSAWADMLANATAEEYIQATIVINGEKIANAGIRPKGNSSLSTVARDSTTDRFSFKIEFDHYIDGQTWLGLDKLAVNNMQGDASYMKEYLSYDIMSYAGVEAPLYAFADISVNGEAWGFYLAVECLEDSYAQRVYGNDHGMLYKPESMGMRGDGRMNEFIENMQNEGVGVQNDQSRTWQGQQGGGNFANMQGGMGGGFGGMTSGGVSLEYTGDDLSNYSAIFDNAVFKATEIDYQRVVSALGSLAEGENLQNVVDVEATLKYFAAHTVVVNLDSYVSNMGHNYYLYEDDGRLTILPWDYNLAFGGFQSGDASGVVNFPIDTPVSGVSLASRPLLGKLLEVSEYMDLYHDYLRQIVDGYFNSGVFERTVDALNEAIAEYVRNDSSAFYSFDAYSEAVGQLKALGLLRAESIEGQLDGVIPATTAGQSADASNLVDASGISLSRLGSQGFGNDMGGGSRGGQNGFGGMGANGGVFGGNAIDGGVMPGMPNTQGTDGDLMQKAMEILMAAGENGLGEEEMAKLRELGLTDEQIAQLSAMFSGGQGARGMQTAPGMQDAIGGMNRQRGDNQQGAVGGDMDRGAQVQSQPPAAMAANAGTGPWMLTGVCAALLAFGLAFVMRYRRRGDAAA